MKHDLIALAIAALVLMVLAAAFVRAVRPSEPELLIDATPAAAPSEGPSIPLTVCVRVMPVPRRDMVTHT